MGMRPPPTDDGSDGPSAVDFGIAALDVHLDGADLTFPATDDEVVTALDDPEVPYDPRGNAVALSTAIERTGRRQFDTQRELLEALHPVFEEFRTGSSGGVLAWLRSRVPFL